MEVEGRHGPSIQGSNEEEGRYPSTHNIHAPHSFKEYGTNYAYHLPNYRELEREILESVLGTMSFPDKSSREKCWMQRDQFWDCLNANESTPKEKNPCSELRALYVSACPAQWVKHFDRRREYLKFKAKIENDGFEPIAELK
ncbi:hypothetical protein GE061_015730 [Apolygus lucorum]|uniref:Cytochrome c oxidase assembly factor 6 n=1 Tax=Apolygus lucorum TaxID=248454 RepID=A0A6A4JKN2_APOLU|nr:hypothetical protein GE061_015730 [Apolygus lucorum]